MTLHPYQSAFGPLGLAVSVSDRRSLSNRLVVPAPPVRDVVPRVLDDVVRLDDPRDEPDRDDVLDRFELRDEVRDDDRFEEDERDEDELVRPEDRADDVDEVHDERDDDEPDDDEPDEVERDDEEGSAVEREDEEDVVERDEEREDEESVVERDVGSLDDCSPACPGNLNLLRPSSRFSTYVRWPIRS
ncbi:MULTISPECIES: hypothetical protein [Haloferax]|uniref:hypothetical protein n=1 Tax=Haloferax TaxID=2251 RepID=UPI002B4084BA|nr:hypothetical protein [Haloferax marinum]